MPNPSENGREDCREQILSDEYADLIVSQDRILPEFVDMLPCLEPVSGNVSVLHVKRELLPADPLPYSLIPKLYGLMDETALESSGILQARNQPVLNLKGQGVLIGIVDTGIDYRNPAFLDRAGRTRILRIWDQTVQEGTLPEGFSYGSEYTAEEINGALSAGDAQLVPSVDTGGHGTFLASVAAGSELPQQDFSGAAPEASLAVVKLKPAKEYLRNYYLIKEGVPAYQENDLMMGVSYLRSISSRLNLPLVVLIGVGTSLGGHTGTGPLNAFLNDTSGRLGTAVTAASGNETNRGHHYFGEITARGGVDYVEIRVPQGERGFTMELWAEAPEVYSIQLLSPTGENTGRIVPRLNQNSVFQYIMEGTVVYVNYQLVERDSGSTVIQIRIAGPTPGIWTLAVYNEQYINGQFHIWLPIEGFVSPDTVFLRPSPETTLTEPSAAEGPVTFGAYDHRRESVYIHSGRGFTRTGGIKPDLVAPGVEVYGAFPGGRFGTMTGTSVSAALGAGAAALLLEWGIYQGNYKNMRTRDIKSLMIRGARRNEKTAYPNRSVGYGALDLFHIFETISI